MAGIGLNCGRSFPRFLYGDPARHLYAGLISSRSLGAVDRQRDADRRAEPRLVVPDVLVRQFLITVTYLMALSLIFTGDCNCSSPASFPIACSSARGRSCPTWWGVLLLVTLAAGLLGDIAGDPVR